MLSAKGSSVTSRKKKGKAATEIANRIYGACFDMLKACVVNPMHGDQIEMYKFVLQLLIRNYLIGDELVVDATTSFVMYVVFLFFFAYTFFEQQ